MLLKEMVYPSFNQSSGVFNQATNRPKTKPQKTQQCCGRECTVTFLGTTFMHFWLCPTVPVTCFDVESKFNTTSTLHPKS
ncbi:unnamed protein product [Arctogadus glacialis]